MKFYFSIIVSVIMIVFLTQCTTTSKISEPTADNIRAGYSLDEVLKGKQLFTAKCEQCHRLYSPSKHDDNGWTATLNRMQPKAKISDDEKSLIFKYLTSAKI